MSQDESSELIDLSDLTFDFEDYFRRYNEGEMDGSEREDFDPRVIGMFVRDVFANRPPPDWVCLRIAKAFHYALGGDELSDVFRFPSPWAQPIDRLTKTTRKQLDLYCAIANFSSENPEYAITECFQAVADAKFVSKKTAEAAYYIFNKKVKTSEALRTADPKNE